MKYVYLWLFFLFLQSVYHGHRAYEEYRKAGYNIDCFEKTGVKIPIRGGFGERCICTLAGVLGLLISPFFLATQTLLFMPAAIMLYLFS